MNKNFVFLGDSLTFGYGVKPNEGWVYLLSQNIDFNVINKGVNGDTTVSMMDRFYNDVSSNNPSHIFIMGGTNDLLLGRSIEKIIDNINELINDSKKLTSNIIIGIPPIINKEMANRLFMPSPLYTYCSDSLKEIRNKLINLCNKNKIKYIDFYSISLNNIHKNIFLDGIHYNCLGNTIFFKEALKLINSFVK